MKWAIGNTQVTVSQTSQDEEVWLGDYLSYVDRQYNPRLGRIESKTVKLYTPLLGTFPAGFARATYVEARKRGHSVEFVDTRTKPCGRDHSVDLSWLRRHQAGALDAVEKFVRGVVKAPTGAGKTVIASAIVAAFPCKWIFLVPRSSLLRQTAERFEEFTGLQAGIVGDGKIKIPDGCRFVVCSFQTAHAAFKRGRSEVMDIIRGAEGVLVDECHAVGAATFGATVMETHNAYYRIGVSATPFARGDDRSQQVIAGLGNLIYEVKPEELQEAGLLAIPQIRLIEHPHAASERVTYAGVYNDLIVNDVSRNNHIAEVVKRAAKPCLVFVQHLDHGEDLRRRIARTGVAVEFLSGKNSLDAREAAIQRLERTDIDCLVVNVIFQEGVDIPALRSVVIAAGGASTIATLQRIGRGMRIDKSTGKYTFEVWDIADVGCGCTKSKDPEAPVHKSCRWMETHSSKRRLAYRHEGYEVQVESAQLNLLAATLRP